MARTGGFRFTASRLKQADFVDNALVIAEMCLLRWRKLILPWYLAA
jgi:hypothetical protein